MAKTLVPEISSSCRTRCTALTRASFKKRRPERGDLFVPLRYAYAAYELVFSVELSHEVHVIAGLGKGP